MTGKQLQLKRQFLQRISFCERKHYYCPYALPGACLCYPECDKVGLGWKVLDTRKEVK